MERIKQGVIGYGSSGQVHCRILNNQSPTNLEAICDTNQKKLVLARKLYPQVRVYSTTSDMYTGGNIDAVSICTPHNTHSYLSQEASRQGIHVLCEKPLATTLEDTELMITAAKANNTYLGCIFQHRFEFAPALLKREIDEGKLGDVVSTSISVKWKKEPAYYRGTWKGKKSEAGGGVLINQSIHMIDLASWFNGGVVSAYALTKTVRDHIDVEDNAVALVEYNNGAFGVFDCSTSTNPFLGTGIEVVGSIHTVKLFEGRIVKWGGKTLEEIEELNNQIAKIDKETWGKKYFGYGHIHQIEEFVSAIRKRKEPSINGVEGKNTLRVILAIMQSSKEKKRIMIN